jgi:hypothetical protein
VTRARRQCSDVRSLSKIAHIAGCKLGDAHRFVGNDSLEAPLFFWRPADTRRRQRRIPMELILIIVVVVLLFGGGGYWGRRRGHW